MSGLWVAGLNVSQPTADKINGSHWISVDEVSDAVVCVAGLMYTVHEHPVRGVRVIVQVAIRRADVLVVLYDARHPMGDVWNLGSVYAA